MLHRLINRLLRRQCDYEHSWIVQSVSVEMILPPYPTVIYTCKCKDCPGRVMFAEPLTEEVML